MNEMIAAAKSGRGKGNAYARMKSKWTNDIAIHVKAARIRPVPRAHIRFIWHETSRQRNPDNVAAGQKFCIDGLVVAKVLENDGWSQIVGFTHAWEVSAKPGVMVSLFSSPEVA
jgi:hypothetical protein